MRTTGINAPPAFFVNAKGEGWVSVKLGAEHWGYQRSFLNSDAAARQFIAPYYCFNAFLASDETASWDAAF